MAKYYAQRATAGLIVSEATAISQQGTGCLNTPGIYTDEQVAGWQRVTEAVHLAGGRVFLQLWHMGRVSHPSFQPNGGLPVAPSAIAPQSGQILTETGMRPYVTPRALETEELPGIVSQYAAGAQRAQRAGFDGVEIHNANGYLLDQFLQDGTNKRTDKYGGSIENRAKLMLEAVDAAVKVWGPGRVGLHLAPRRDSHDMSDSTPAQTFGYVAEQVGKRGIAFIAAREHVGPDSLGPSLKKAFGGAYIANEGFTKESAEAILASGNADAVAFGKLFIANPDLPKRFATGAKLNEWDSSTFYGGNAKGYTDYPALDLVDA